MPSNEALTRRCFLAGSGLGVVGLGVPALAGGAAPPSLPDASDRVPSELARDVGHWRRVAAQYPLDTSVDNLEGGYWGPMALPVLHAYQRHTERVNREGSLYARRRYDADLEAARGRVAAALGVAVDEVAFTRGATEALQNLIGGYNRLRLGDQVMYCDLDYHSMQWAMNWLEARRGVEVVRIDMPEPATRSAVLDRYARALDGHPRVKLLLLTHISHRTGLVLPVAQVAALAAERRVDVILDSAHAWGQVDFAVPDLGVDFAGFNLHKWIGAPVGVGLLYIRRDRLPDIDRAMADEDHPPDDVRSRVHSGTANFAAFLAVPAALDFHARVGARNKEARLRYLRDRWVAAARGLPGVEILTPDDPEMVAGMTSFRLAGRTTKEHNDALVEMLLDRYGIFTVRRSGLAHGDCVRVTPGIYTSEEQVDRLAAALREISAS